MLAAPQPQEAPALWAPLACLRTDERKHTSPWMTRMFS